MKKVLALLLTGLSLNLSAQLSEWEKCGLDDSITLNQYEEGYFNEAFADRRGDFDFTGKKVAFFYGSSGTVPTTKANYFGGIKDSNDKDNYHTWFANGTQLVILTPEEKKLSGGYDAILISWSKIEVEGKRRAKLVKELGKGNS